MTNKSPNVTRMLFIITQMNNEGSELTMNKFLGILSYLLEELCPQLFAVFSYINC